MKEVEAKRTKLQTVKTMKRYPVFEFISFCMITNFFLFWYMFRKHFELSHFPYDKQRTNNIQMQKQPPNVFNKKRCSLKFCLRPATLLKKGLRHMYFPVNFGNSLRTLFWTTPGNCFYMNTQNPAKHLKWSVLQKQLMAFCSILKSSIINIWLGFWMPL